MEVRVLFGQYGMQNDEKSVTGSASKNEGIQVAEFFPALLGQLQLRVNLPESQKKSLLLTEESVLVGGFNVGREYLGRDKNSVIGGIPICVSKARR